MPEAKPNIVLFSRPVRSGKTTGLFKFVLGKDNVGGILTPDKGGVRVLYDIAAQTFYEFEIAPGTAGPAIAVGRFRFAPRAFDTAKDLFADAASSALFIVDEVGKLEVEFESGFEPQLGALIDAYKTGEYTGTLLLVVRDTLLEAARTKYGLNEVRVIGEIEAL